MTLDHAFPLIQLRQHFAKIGAAESLAHDEMSAVGQRDLDMAQLRPKVFGGLSYDLRRDRPRSADWHHTDTP